MTPKNPSRKLLLSLTLLCLLAQKSLQDTDSEYTTYRPGCEQKRENVCIRCEDGYYLEREVCFKCNEDCKTCRDSVGCLTCADGSFNKSSTAQGYAECQKCFKGCKICHEETVCTECDVVYEKLEEGKVCKFNLGKLAVTILLLILVFCVICLCPPLIYFVCAPCVLIFRKKEQIRARPKQSHKLVGGLQPVVLEPGTSSRFNPAPYSSSNSRYRNPNMMRPHTAVGCPQPMGGQILDSNFNHFNNGFNPRVY